MLLVLFENFWFDYMPRRKELFITIFTIVMHCYWHGVELIVIWELVFLHFFDCLLFIIVNDKFSFE